MSDPAQSSHVPVAAGGFSGAVVALIVIIGNKHGLAIDPTEAVLWNVVVQSAVGFITKTVQDYLYRRTT